MIGTYDGRIRTLTRAAGLDAVENVKRSRDRSGATGGPDSGRHSGLEDEIGPELLQAGLLSNSPANVIVNRYLVIEP